jgi:hypothetical protein
LWVLSQPLAAESPSTSPIIAPTLALIGDNSLVGIVSPCLEEGQVLGTIIDSPEVKLEYETLIGKLCNCESGNRANIINPNDKWSPSYGILQFKKPTYQIFCIDKYGFDDDIMNPDNQKQCANKMIQENFDNVLNWFNCYYKSK